jgi:hypothetical protein
MKMFFLLTACGTLISAAFPQLAEAAPPLNQNATTLTVPSIEAAQAMIIGEWTNMIGPNPSTTRITRDTFWNSQCWSHYKILGIRPGKIKKTDAYVVELEFTSAGGPGQCGHSDDPSFSIALISADAAVSSEVTTIYWLDCSSEKDFQAALKYQDPRDFDAACSSYVSIRRKHDRSQY